MPDPPLSPVTSVAPPHPEVFRVPKHPPLLLARPLLLLPPPRHRSTRRTLHMTKTASFCGFRHRARASGQLDTEFRVRGLAGAMGDRLGLWAGP